MTRSYAALEQANDFPWEVAKIHKDPLLCFQSLEFFFGKFQGVQQKKVILARQMYPQYLYQRGRLDILAW